MNEQWIAVARGLKCQQLSLKATVYGAVLFLVAVRLMEKMRFPSYTLLPGGLLILVGLVISRVAQLMFLRVPRVVPKGRFLAMSSLFFGLVWVMVPGTLFAIYMVFDIRWNKTGAIGWMIGITTLWALSVGFHHRLLRGLALSLRHDEISHRVSVAFMLWLLFGAGFVYGFIALAVHKDFYGQGWKTVVVLTTIQILSAVYEAKQILRPLRFSMLRQAVREERFGQNRG